MNVNTSGSNSPDFINSEINTRPPSKLPGPEGQEQAEAIRNLQEMVRQVPGRKRRTAVIARFDRLAFVHARKERPED